MEILSKQTCLQGNESPKFPQICCPQHFHDALWRPVEYKNGRDWTLPVPVSHYLGAVTWNRMYSVPVGEVQKKQKLDRQNNYVQNLLER